MVPKTAYAGQDKPDYYEVEIKCPYCFGSFHHNEVKFRAKNFEEESKELIRKISSGDMDETETKQCQDRLKLLGHYTGQKDIKFHEYWNRMGWADNAELFENSDGYDEYNDNVRKTVLSDVQDPVIDFESDLIEELHIDEDGFIVSAIDKIGDELDRRICPHCHNKLPKNYGKNPIKFISVVGISGSGKTVMLYQLIENIKDYAAKAGATVTFDNENSAKKFIEKNKTKINGLLPESTKPHFVPPIFLQFSKKIEERQKQTTLVIYDIAGESCISADGIKEYGPFIRNSDGIMLLLDPEQISAFACAKEGAANPTDVLSAMGNAFLLENNEMCTVPLAVAYSKSDKLREAGIDDINYASHIFKNITYSVKPSGFMYDQYINLSEEVKNLIQKYSSTLYTNIFNFFNKNNVGFFAFSTLGYEPEKEGKRSIVSQNITPCRIEEPMLWLMYKWGLIDEVREASPKRKGILPKRVPDEKGFRGFIRKFGI